jgi:hypothetical protein
MSGRFQPDNGADSAQSLADAIAHEHRFGLILGPDGHGQIYGNYEGYVRRCGGMGSDGCGEYALDFVTFQERRKAQQLADAIALVETEDQLFNEVMAGFDRAIQDPEALQRLKDAGFIVPACIACSERALPNNLYCAGHDRLGTYTDHERLGGIAANE